MEYSVKTVAMNHSHCASVLENNCWRLFCLLLRKYFNVPRRRLQEKSQDKIVSWSGKKQPQKLMACACLCVCVRVCARACVCIPFFSSPFILKTARAWCQNYCGVLSLCIESYSLLPGIWMEPMFCSSGGSTKICRMNTHSCSTNTSLDASGTCLWTPRYHVKLT